MAVLVLLGTQPGFGQPGSTNPPPGSQDPMMMLMLSQPKLDTTSPVVAEAAFDPPLVRPGERTIYRITLNALRDSISWNGKLPSTKFPLRPGAIGQTMQMAGTNVQPRTSFNYHARASEEGRFMVPSFVITVGGKSVRVPETFFVAANVPTSAPPQMLQLEIVPERPFVGESARVRVLSPAGPSGVVQALGQVQLVGEGFIHELSANKQSVETLPTSGRMTANYIYETRMTPLSPGKQSIYAQAFAVGNRFSGNIVITGPAVISGNILQYTLLDSDPVQLEFRPLPPEGRLPGFSGAVGAFSIDPPQITTNAVLPGEPVKLTVAVRGQGNLGRLVLPEPPALADWQILPAKRENLPVQVVEARGFATFIYTLVPLKSGLQSTPELPFSFFDPDKETYVARNIPAVPLTVLPGKLPPDLDALLKQRIASGPKEPVLSEIAQARGVTVGSLVPIQLRGWFPAVQLAPAILFLGLWQWDRRRRYFEAHPEILLRRRALRQLKRERRRMFAAARRGNPAEFQASAVRAVQIVSAPSLAAEPDAIVSTDVLGLLGDRAPADARAAVERLFEVNNAERYAGKDPGNLLAERQRLIRALDALETAMYPAPRVAAVRREEGRSWLLPACMALCLAWRFGASAQGIPPEGLFQAGATAYWGGNYEIAAYFFAEEAERHPSAGAFLNLGNAEWRRGRTGRAVLAWERAAWIDPFNGLARNNLQFARRSAQLDAPYMAWYEVASSWLPARWWAWISGLSLWAAISGAMLPPILRLRRSAWHQAASALGLALFLLCLPAQVGVGTRAHQGFVLERDTPLRLTPTRDAQFNTRLAAGEAVRFKKKKGDFLLVRTLRSQGWIEARAFGGILPDNVR